MEAEAADDGEGEGEAGELGGDRVGRLAMGSSGTRREGGSGEEGEDVR